MTGGQRALMNSGQSPAAHPMAALKGRNRWRPFV